MFERMTDQSRRAIVRASDEARFLRRDKVDAPHLVLGMLHDEDSAVSQAFSRLGVDLELAREKTKSTFGMGATAPGAHVPFTDNAKACLERSLREALQLGHGHIGTEHLLLAIIRRNDDNVIDAFGIDPHRLRQEVIAVLQGRLGDTQATVAQEEPKLRTSAEISAEIEALEDRMGQLKLELNAAVKHETGCDPSYHH
jgi:ATP-dependent Clp protease ATP-binding subunit ClpC